MRKDPMNYLEIARQVINRRSKEEAMNAQLTADELDYMTPPRNECRVRLLITPILAEAWLQKNTHNRPLSPTYAEKLADDMRNGRWMENGDSIRFDSNAVLADGQHRLAACTISHRPFWADVHFGLSPDAMKTIDIGNVRTAAHIMAIDGLKNCIDLAAIANKVIIATRYGGFQNLTQHSLHPSKTEVMDYVYKHLDRINKSMPYGRGQFISISLAAAFHYVFSQVSEDKANSFFLELRDGALLEDTSPVLLLRSRLLANKMSRTTKLGQKYLCALVILAWNAYLRGQPMKNLRWIPDLPFPKIETSAN